MLILSQIQNTFIKEKQFMKRYVDSFEFHFPRDGVMLTYSAGKKVENGLKIRIVFTATDKRRLALNGIPMENYNFCLYRLDYVLTDYKTTLTVEDTDTHEKCSIDVFFLKNGSYKYRFSLDDNIWFLQDLTENKNTYRSMFDHPYLSLLKSIHDKYDSKFHLNIYYETPRHNGFNLTQMTDRYKDEWKANSDWLRLSFHANADKPDRPYIHATYEQAYFEMERVNREIVRFAGKEAFANTVTTIHWGDCTVEAAKAFRDLGVKAYVSCCYTNSIKAADIRMYCDDEQSALVRNFGFFYDKETDMYHFRYWDAFQHEPVENVINVLERNLTQTPYYTYIDIGLHEQYFFPEYPAHQSNYYEKMDTIANWCKEHGFEPMFMDDVMEFNRK